MKTSYAETGRLKLACAPRCRAVAGQRSSSSSRNNVKPFRGCFSGGCAIPLYAGVTLRASAVVYLKKKESAASDVLYRNFYLTLKSTQQRDLRYTFKS